MKRVIKHRLNYRLLVTLKSGDTFDGVLYEEDEQAWVLRNAQAVQVSDGSTMPVDGEVLILTSDIAFAQRP